MLLSSVGFVALGCLRAGVPDPRVTANEWAEAADKGDADALHGLLTRRGQATVSRAEVATTVGSAKAELRAQAGEIRRATKEPVPTVALLRYPDGTEATLVLEEGRFALRSGGFLPGGGAHPEETIAAFRDALRRRSYGALLRLLSPNLRAVVEAQLSGLERAIPDDPRKVVPTEAGDELEIKLDDGHRLKLRRVDKTWYIENFE